MVVSCLATGLCLNGRPLCTCCSGCTVLAGPPAVPMTTRRGRWRASRAAQRCPARTPSPSAKASLPPRGRLQREAPASFLVPKSRHRKPPPEAMASPPGSPEDAGKLRGDREGRQRREDDAPEQKRLRLGLRAGSEPQDGATAPLPTRDELATHTGGEDRDVSNLGAAGTWVRAVVVQGSLAIAW